MIKEILQVAFIILSLLILESCKNDQEKITQQPQAKIQTQAAEGENYMQIGKQLAVKTKAALNSNLMEAIAANGYGGAVSFCNLKALPITDSLSKAFNAKIRRVSDKTRNPKNQAKEGELFYIDMCKKALEDNKELKPFISEDEKNFMGYYPIVTNQLCSNCHGTSSDINKKALAKINSLYPKDQAIDYKANEVRGLFVIEIEK